MAVADSTTVTHHRVTTAEQCVKEGGVNFGGERHGDGETVREKVTAGQTDPETNGGKSNQRETHRLRSLWLLTAELQ